MSVAVKNQMTASEQDREIQRVGILGCGLMGAGIAQVAAQAGYKTIVLEVTADRVAQGLSRIDAFLTKGVQKGKVTPEDRAATLERLSGTTRYEDLSNVDVVVEAVIEDVREKRLAFEQLEQVVSPDTIFTSNTSSLCITELASGTRRPDRFVGLHFFNPVPLMKLVEVIRALTTSDAAYRRIFEFAKTLGKEPITAPDRPGFVVNRLLVPYLLDAIRAYENGLGSVEDIDKGMKIGCGYPMGPFTLLDFVGLDTTYYVANIMFDEFRDPAYAPPPLLKRMVHAGWLGRKAGRGFYTY